MFDVEAVLGIAFLEQLQLQFFPLSTHSGGRLGHFPSKHFLVFYKGKCNLSTISSILDEVLSVNPSANIFNTYHKECLTYSSSIG